MPSRTLRVYFRKEMEQGVYTSLLRRKHRLKWNGKEEPEELSDDYVEWCGNVKLVCEDLGNDPVERSRPRSLSITIGPEFEETLTPGCSRENYDERFLKLALKTILKCIATNMQEKRWGREDNAQTPLTEPQCIDLRHFYGKTEKQREEEAANDALLREQERKLRVPPQRLNDQ
jgi:hypothetical protein